MNVTESGNARKEQLKALWDVGWIHAIDIVFFLLVLTAYVITFFWWLFGAPEPIHVVATLVGTCVVKITWMIVLLFRNMYFCIQTLARMNTLPIDSARALAKHYGSSRSGTADSAE